MLAPFSARTPERTREIQLGLLASASLLIYTLALVLPYSLLEFWDTPELTIAKITRGDWHAGAAYVIAFIALFAAYLSAALLTRSHQSVTMWRVVIIGALAFNLVMLFLYTVDSVDIFDNIIRGRMQALYHANPFYDTPVQFSSDPFHRYNAWDYIPSAYGPGWETLAALAALVAGDSVVANVLAFKLVSLIAYVATAVVIAVTLRRIAPHRTLFGVTLFAWNPLAIFVIAGNGHNDAVMVFFLALGFLFLARKNFSLAVLAEMLGALVKFIPILLVPLLMLAGIKHLHAWQARIRFVVLTTVACIVMTILAYAPYWHDDDVLGSKWRSGNFTTSLPTLIQVSLIPALGKDVANELVSRAALVVMALWVAHEARLVWRHSDPNQIVRSSLSILIFYLLIACLWVQAWYALWLLPLVALASDDWLTHGALLISFFFAMKMPFFDFVMGVNDTNLPSRAIREWQITLLTLTPLWIYFLWKGLVIKWKMRFWLSPNSQLPDKPKPV